MTRRAFIPVVLILFAVVFLRLAAEYTELRHLRPLAAFYVTQAPIELGVANIVTAILITYRGFDTLGEVAVLFMVAASVGMLLTHSETAPGAGRGRRGLAARSQRDRYVGRADFAAFDPGLRGVCHRQRPPFGRRRLSGAARSSPPV